MQLLLATITKLTLPLPYVSQTAVKAVLNMQPAADQNCKLGKSKHQNPPTILLATVWASPAACTVMIPRYQAAQHRICLWNVQYLSCHMQICKACDQSFGLCTGCEARAAGLVALPRHDPAAAEEGDPRDPSSTPHPCRPPAQCQGSPHRSPTVPSSSSPLWPSSCVYQHFCIALLDAHC